MRALVLVLTATAAASGCAKDPCAGATGVCIAAEMTGDISALDQLRIAVDTLAPSTVLTPPTPSSITLPVKVGIVLPSGTSGTVQVTVYGLSSGTPIASAGPQAVALPSHGTVTFRLVGGVLPSDDMSVAPDDLSSSTDLADSDLSIVTSNGMLMISQGIATFASTPRQSTAATPAHFTVTNIGNASITPGAPTVIGAQASSFALAGTCNATTMLAPNDTCTIDVTFTPTVSGTNNATLGIGGLAASLTGTGTPIFVVENSNLANVYSLWGASATEVLAATGNAITVSTGNGTWLNRNNGLTSGHNYVVGGSGTGDEHAVGLSSTAQPTSNHLLWDGTQWNSTLITSTSTLMLSAVTSTSSSDAFAVGSDGGAHGALWHYDGTFWTEFSFPALKDAGLGGVNLVSVSAPAPGVAWTVGSAGTILTWNAGVFTDVSFSVTPAPPTVDFATVWAKSATEAWISGSNGLVIHINGNALDDQSLPTNAGTVRLSGRVVAGGVELWAIFGASAYRSTGKNDWTPVTLPGIATPAALWVQPNGDVYIGSNSGAIAHYY